MSINVLPVALSGFNIDCVQIINQDLHIAATSTAKMGTCPSCQQPSHHTHGWYCRHPNDLPCIGKRVWLKLRVRRFQCLNPVCNRKTFAQENPDWLPQFARRTVRLTQLVYQIGFEVGGECARRILRDCSIEISGDTVLRVLRAKSATTSPTARVIGVDDWAFKKGQRYGTIIVDLEKHRVIDLLPDRTASTLKDWLEHHPEIEVVARDRSTEYIAGIVSGAPQAIQVADRWHLLLNVRQMLERFLSTIYARLQQLPASDEVTQLLQQKRTAFRRTRAEQLASQTSRNQRLARYQRIQQMRHEGYNIAQIARLLGHHRETVRKYYYATTFPERKRRRTPSSLLEPYLPYLESRHQQGCENAMQLWREIRAQGYIGSRRQVSKWMQLQRTQIAPTTPHNYRDRQLVNRPKHQTLLPSTRQLAWLLVREPKQLADDDTLLLRHLQQDDELLRVYTLVQQFTGMIKQRAADQLDPWLDACANSSAVQLVHFALGIQQDYAAVRAALETKWSNGQTEGQVNPLKSIKRQMFGRAHFDLLRLRVVHPP